MEWLDFMYECCKSEARVSGIELPDFDDFWEAGIVEYPPAEATRVFLENFRIDPKNHKLNTPSGRIEIYSDTIESFHYKDCPPMPTWLEPEEWLGSKSAQAYPVHLISNQPATRLHSQYDIGVTSLRRKISGREPVMINVEDAKTRGIKTGDKDGR